jgi:hypothetical protein
MYLSEARERTPFFFKVLVISKEEETEAILSL